MTCHHTLINYNLLRSELWHKIVLFYVSLILFFIYTKVAFELSYSIFGMWCKFHPIWVFSFFLLLFMGLITFFSNIYEPHYTIQLAFRFFFFFYITLLSLKYFQF